MHALLPPQPSGCLLLPGDADTACTPSPSQPLQPSSAHRGWSLIVPMKVVKINQLILCRNSSLYAIFVSFGCDSGFYQLRSCEHQVEMFSAAAAARSQPTCWCPLNASLIGHSKAEGLRHILCPLFHHS